MCLQLFPVSPTEPRAMQWLPLCCLRDVILLFFLPHRCYFLDSVSPRIPYLPILFIFLPILSPWLNSAPCPMDHLSPRNTSTINSSSRAINMPSLRSPCWSFKNQRKLLPAAGRWPRNVEAISGKRATRTERRVELISDPPTLVYLDWALHEVSVFFWVGMVSVWVLFLKPKVVAKSVSNLSVCLEPWAAGTEFSSISTEWATCFGVYTSAQTSNVIRRFE